MKLLVLSDSHGRTGNHRQLAKRGCQRGRFSLTTQGRQRTVPWYRRIGAASGSKLKKSRANDPKRFVEQEYCTQDGEVASTAVTSLNQTQMQGKNMRYQ